MTAKTSTPTAEAALREWRRRAREWLCVTRGKPGSCQPGNDGRNAPTCGWVGGEAAISAMADGLRASGADVLCVRSHWHDGEIVREWRVTWPCTP